MRNPSINTKKVYFKKKKIIFNRKFTVNFKNEVKDIFYHFRGKIALFPHGES